MKSLVLVTVALGLALGACGDNIVIDDTPLPPAQTLVIAAHFDDDEIFMQPELVNAIAAESLTSVYVTTGDQVDGLGHSNAMMHDAMLAYGELADSADWQCGYTAIAGFPTRRCTLADRGVTLIALDVPDGGIDGHYRDSLLHLLDGSVTSLPLLGALGGYTVTRDDIVAELVAIITASAPAQIHTLDVTGMHGYDNSSHVLTGGLVLWAAAQVGFTGALRIHRGYNVETEAATLTGVDYARPGLMLGYFDACYTGCGPCGYSCADPSPPHQTWMERQYFLDRLPSASGLLALAGGAQCATVSAGQLVLAGCDGASSLALDPSGHLMVDGQCVAAGDSDSLALAACADTPAQYWLLDGEGNLWNGAPVTSAMLTSDDHARCLYADATPGAALAAPICGQDLNASWSLAAP